MRAAPTLLLVLAIGACDRLLPFGLAADGSLRDSRDTTGGDSRRAIVDGSGAPADRAPSIVEQGGPPVLGDVICTKIAASLPMSSWSTPHELPQAGYGTLVALATRQPAASDPTITVRQGAQQLTHVEGRTWNGVGITFWHLAPGAAGSGSTLFIDFSSGVVAARLCALDLTGAVNPRATRAETAPLSSELSVPLGPCDGLAVDIAAIPAATTLVPDAQQTLNDTLLDALDAPTEQSKLTVGSSRRSGPLAQNEATRWTQGGAFSFVMGGVCVTR